MYELNCRVAGRNAVQTVGIEANQSNTVRGAVILLRAQLCLTSNSSSHQLEVRRLIRRGKKHAVLKSRPSDKLNTAFSTR